jgi:hypothetical protein
MMTSRSYVIAFGAEFDATWLCTIILQQDCVLPAACGFRLLLCAEQ